MNNTPQHSINKNNSKAKNILVTSIAAAILAVGISIPIGAFVVGQAQEGSQMGGAPGAVATPSDSQHTKDKALATVKTVYEFRPNTQGSVSIEEQTDSIRRDNLSPALQARTTADAKSLNYDPVFHLQQVPDEVKYGPVYINNDTAYVVVDLYTGPADNRVMSRSIVVSVDTTTNKIVGIGAEYK